MTLTIDFNSVNPLSQGSVAGELGENNAVVLSVIPETDMTDNPAIVSYMIMFGTKEGVIPSAAFPQSGQPLEVTLNDSITKNKSFSLQLWAMNTDGAIIMKSRMLHLFLKPSVYGEYVGDESGTLLAQIADFLNTHYTNAEINLLLAGKSDTGHTHAYSEITDIPDILPPVTADDNGDFLCVVNGEWNKKKLNYAEEVDYLGLV
ncbi:MAG: hypothetical protein IK085_08335 [Clostridia bacterium]|nr:hypothetical protein [Clostridia bacterium]